MLWPDCYPMLLIGVATPSTFEVATLVMLMINNIVNLTLLFKGLVYFTHISNRLLK